MGTVETRLTELGITLPGPLILPSENRTSAVQVGQILYVSGHGSDLLQTHQVSKHGKVGTEVSLDEAYQTTRQLGLMMLATIKEHISDLDRVARVVKLVGMVNAVPDFEHHNKVINGVSDLFYEVFGKEVGCHARSSVGVSGLVARQCVEIEAIIQIRE